MKAQQSGLLDHRVAVHGSDEEFLACTVPFLLEGIAADEEPPPLVVTTPAKLDLVRDALGRDARLVAFVPSTEWYTGSAANALAHAAGYVMTNAGPDGSMHAVAEPDWTGRAGSSAREAAEWIRYESMINVLLAPFAVNAICPYDTRTTSPDIVAAALRSHPTQMYGADRLVSRAYEDPFDLIATLDASPLPEPPADAAVMVLDRDVVAVSRFVREQATRHGLGFTEAGTFEAAVAEVVHYVLGEGIEDATIRMWAVPDASVCEVHSRTGRINDLLLGYRPPDSLELLPGQGLWFTRQVCDYVDVRSGAGGWTVRMQS